MTFTKQTCLLLSCDGICGKVLEHEYIPHFDTEQEGQEDAENCDWIFAGGKAWCGFCEIAKCTCGGNFDDHRWEEDEGCSHCDGQCRRYQEVKE